MTSKTALILGIGLPWLGLALGLLLTIAARRLSDRRIPIYFLLPPILTVAMDLLAQSVAIKRTWAYSLIAVCAWALIYAVYLVKVKDDLKLKSFFLGLWRFYLAIAGIWYLFILVWVLAK